MTIHDWALKWGISDQAIAELISAVPRNVDTGGVGVLEAKTLQDTRIYAPELGALLWRNNRGVAHSGSRVVRFGLANDSAAANARIKSHDLIGIDKDGRFVSIECKRRSWVYSGTKEEKAQLVWSRVIEARGGRAGFVTNANQLKSILSK